MSIIPLVFSAALFGLCLAQEPDCICLEEFQTPNGLRSPTIFSAPPDGTGRNFISEQIGIVWIFDDTDTMLPDPFLDLSQTVLAGSERGFLALTFHPDYVTNRKLYIYYSVEIAGDEYTRLSEIQASATDPNVVDYSTERMLMEFFQPFSNHNGGDLLFGVDGYLYMGVGDGGAAGDPEDNGQNLQTYLGNVLRIDVNVGSAEGEYGIPPDNPFLSDPDALSEIYAYGFRNPWRISMDIGDPNTSEGRGRMFVGDVGQNAFEEVDILELGGNFGWAGREGFECYKQPLCDSLDPATEVLPVIAYSHDIVGQCVIGGYVYRGSRSPNFNGVYFFGDWDPALLLRMIETAPGEFEFSPVSTCSTACTGGLINTFGNYILAFGQDQQGEVYFLTSDAYSTSDTRGRAFRIVDPTA